MAIRIIDNKFDINQYYKLASHPLQSWEWGEARKKLGVEVLRVADGKNVFQLTFHRIPFTNYKVGYLPRSVWPSKEVLDFLYEYGTKNNIIFIKIEPYIQKSQITNHKSQKNFKFQISNFKLKPSSHPLFPEWTQILDLTKPEDELLKNMHHKTRYNIKLAQKKGVVVKEMSDKKGFEIFSKLYFDTCKRQQYFGHTPRYHKIIWESLKNNIAHILVAFYNDVPIATYELFYFKGVFYYPYGGTSLEYRNVMAANLLMWETIRFGKTLGAKKFDMWGSLPPQYDANHSWAGFTRFKEGYGGTFIQFAGSYDLIMNQFGYKIYTLLYRIREKYLTIRKKFS